jgi:hypothetical protein
MATISQLKTAPHTRIENTIIANMSDIGVYCYAVYSAIKMHANQATGDCFPSYATIARITGVHRSTVIECVKKLRGLKLISPQWRFKEDGSHASNQYNFQGAGNSADKLAQTDQGSRPEQSPLVAAADHPGRPQQPEQSSSLNKKQRTITDVDFYAEKATQLPHSTHSISHLSPQIPITTERQKTCPHPPSEIVFLAENVTICHHCYGLLDQNLTLIEEKTPIQSGNQPPEIVEAA